jgi:hypothetical protein
LGACGGGAEGRPPGPAGANVLENPGFEEGADPWFTLDEDSGFVVTGERAHSGRRSALLRMRDPAQAQGARVYYLVQEVSPPEMPEVLSGYYRVEGWNKGTRRQYLQAVVIAFRPSNFPQDASNYQIRYPLAGIDSPPFAIANAHFVFLGRGGPVEDQWVYFETNLREDFQRMWGRVPEGFEKLRILFEVRWDGKRAGDGAPEGDVYYDDLYLGPAR